MKRHQKHYFGGAFTAFIMILVVNPPFSPLEGIVYIASCALICMRISIDLPLTWDKPPS